MGCNNSSNHKKKQDKKGELKSADGDKNEDTNGKAVIPQKSYYFFFN